MLSWMNHTICHGNMDEEAHNEWCYAQNNTLFFTYILHTLKYLKTVGEIKH